MDIAKRLLPQNEESQQLHLFNAVADYMALYFSAQ